MGDKYAAHLFFERHGIASPRSWLPDDVPDDARYPLLVKVREGFGSRHIYRAHDRAELDFFLRYTTVDSFVQDRLPGRGVLDRRLLRPRRPLPERDPADDDPVEGRRIDQGHVDQGHRADRARRRGRRGASASSGRPTSSASASPTGRSPSQMSILGLEGLFRCRSRRGRATLSSRWRWPTANVRSRGWATSAQGS